MGIQQHGMACRGWLERWGGMGGAWHSSRESYAQAHDISQSTAAADVIRSEWGSVAGELLQLWPFHLGGHWAACISWCC